MRADGVDFNWVAWWACGVLGTATSCCDVSSILEGDWQGVVLGSLSQMESLTVGMEEEWVATIAVVYESCPFA